MFYCVFYEIVKILSLFLCLVIRIFVITLVLILLGNEFEKIMSKFF